MWLIFELDLPYFLASWLVWPSVCPPPMCRWWTWRSAWRNLWVTRRWNTDGFSFALGSRKVKAVFLSLNRPNTMISRRLWRPQPRDPWRAFWATQRTRYELRCDSFWLLIHWLQSWCDGFLCSPAGRLHWLQRRLPLLHLWCRCWHRPQRPLRQTGVMVRLSPRLISHLGFLLMFGRSCSVFAFSPGTTTSSVTAIACVTWWPTWLLRSNSTVAVTLRHILIYSSGGWPSDAPEERSHKANENIVADQLFFICLFSCCACACLWYCSQCWNKVLRLWDYSCF